MGVQTFHAPPLYRSAAFSGVCHLFFYSSALLRLPASTGLQHNGKAADSTLPGGRPVPHRISLTFLELHGVTPGCSSPTLVLYCVNGRGRSGGQAGRATQKPLLGESSPPLQCWQMRELESACRVSILSDALTVPTVAFQGFCGRHQRASAVVCDPNPPRPFARYID